MTDAQLLRLLEDLVTTFNTLTDTVCVLRCEIEELLRERDLYQRIAEKAVAIEHGFRDGDSENGELTAREQARGVVWFGKRTT